MTIADLNVFQGNVIASHCGDETVGAATGVQWPVVAIENYAVEEDIVCFICDQECLVGVVNEARLKRNAEDLCSWAQGQ